MPIVEPPAGCRQGAWVAVAAGIAPRLGAHCKKAEALRHAVAGRASRLTMEAVMTISSRLSSYLEQRGALYEVCAHQHSRTSAQSARTANVPPHELAKSVIVEDDAGCVMAVLPADRHIKLAELSRLLGRKDLRLADESRVAELFADCDRGAVPALGMAWGIETVVDDELDSSPMVYIEAGDHERLLRMSHDQFQALMRSARHGQFSAERAH
jgi:Ala-tRNA(Pro) deacylase